MLVGYVRIFLTILACYWMFTDPLKAALCFTLSHTVLDDLDGIAARRLNQGGADCIKSQAILGHSKSYSCFWSPAHMLLVKFITDFQHPQYFIYHMNKFKF